MKESHSLLALTITPLHLFRANTGNTINVWSRYRVEIHRVTLPPRHYYYYWNIMACVCFSVWLPSNDWLTAASTTPSSLNWGGLSDCLSCKLILWSKEGVWTGIFLLSGLVCSALGRILILPSTKSFVWWWVRVLAVQVSSLFRFHRTSSSSFVVE